MRLSYLVLLSLFVVACQDKAKIQKYRVAKKQDQKMAELAASTHSGIRWTTPKNWQEQKASGMRIASFSIPIKASTQKVDASIVVLGGDGGGLAANVNRWREQVNLKEMTETEINRTAKVESGALGKFRWFPLKGKESSIYAAILQSDEQTIFVKMTGEWDHLQENQAAFLALSKSIRK